MILNKPNTFSETSTSSISFLLSSSDYSPNDNMATAAPVVFTNSDAPVQPDAPTLGPQLPSLPQVPLWQLQEVKQSHNMNSLLEEQLNFLDTSLKFEISAHNEDRRKQHNYLVLSMKQERELMQARAQVQHLNVVVYELRTQIQTDRLKRKEAEDSLSQLLQEEMERFCCVSFLSMVSRHQH